MGLARREIAVNVAEALRQEIEKVKAQCMKPVDQMCYEPQETQRVAYADPQEPHAIIFSQTTLQSGEERYDIVGRGNPTLSEVSFVYSSRGKSELACWDPTSHGVLLEGLRAVGPARRVINESIQIVRAKQRDE